MAEIYFSFRKNSRDNPLWKRHNRPRFYIDYSQDIKWQQSKYHPWTEIALTMTKTVEISSFDRYNRKIDRRPCDYFPMKETTKTIPFDIDSLDLYRSYISLFSLHTPVWLGHFWHYGENLIHNQIFTKTRSGQNVG